MKPKRFWGITYTENRRRKLAEYSNGEPRLFDTLAEAKTGFPWRVLTEEAMEPRVVRITLTVEDES